MPCLKKVCVAESFPPKGCDVNVTGCPDAVISTDCSTPAIPDVNLKQDQQFVTSQENRKMVEAINFYPNPAHSILTVENNQPGTCTIEITSLNGKSVYKRESVGTKIKLDISFLQQGQYIITIRSKNTLRTGKLLKQ
jgi:hypothetical protein